MSISKGIVTPFWHLKRLKRWNACNLLHVVNSLDDNNYRLQLNLPLRWWQDAVAPNRWQICSRQSCQPDSTILLFLSSTYACHSLFFSLLRLVANHCKGRHYYPDFRKIIQEKFIVYANTWFMLTHYTKRIFCANTMHFPCNLFAYLRFFSYLCRVFKGNLIPWSTQN